MEELHWTEVDHVTTIWTDAPPPLRAQLCFRTGQADETLATAGQTHLIEHLALSTLGDTPQDQNGFVGGAATGFFKVGQAQAVTGFLAGVCAALTSLPGDRLEGEKQVLAAENAARPYDFRSNLLTRRYGAAGYGLLGMAQLGIQRATLEQLHEYSAQRFTKENAVLWLSGPPPTELHLRLPHGTRQPLPSLAPIQHTFPSWFLDKACGGVAAGATVPRVFAASIFCEIAFRRLRKRLRTTQAVSYAPSVFYDRLNADTAHLVLYADSDTEHRAELADVFGEVFKELGEVEESEVEAAQRQICEHWIGALAPPPADLMIMEAQRAAMDWILGNEFESIELWTRQLLSVTVDDVLAFSSEMQATAMFALPSGAVLKPWFGQRAPYSTGSVVRGRETLSVDAPIHRERLVYGPDGVSVLFSDGSHCTVRYAELAGALYYEDGSVWLVGFDAATVRIEPTLWRGGESICQKIRERVPAHLVLEQRSRPADAVPRPRTTVWQRFRALLTHR
jgi:zinc protease